MNVNVEELVYLVKLRADDFLKGKATIDAELVKLGKNVGEATDSLEGVGDAASAAGDELESAGKKATDAGKNFKGAGDKVESAGDEFESTGEKAEGAGKKVSGAGKKSRKAGKDTDSLGKSLKQSGKDAAKFGKTTANSFSKVTKYALEFFGVALTLEGARRFFTGMTTDILALSNAASFMDMPIKQMDGFHKAAEAAGSSVAVVDGVLMKMQNAVNWKNMPMGAPDASTMALMRMDAMTGNRFKIMAQKNAQAMTLAMARALRSMPKAQAEQFAGMLGIDSGMFADIRSGAFEKNQGDYAKKSGQSDENAKRAREIKKTLMDLQTTAESIENAIYNTFGDDVNELLKKFDGELEHFGDYIIAHHDDIIGFFKEGSKVARDFSDALGGTSNAFIVLAAAYLAAKRGGIMGPLGLVVAAGGLSASGRIDDLREQASKDHKNVGQEAYDKIHEPKTPFDVMGFLAKHLGLKGDAAATPTAYNAYNTWGGETFNGDYSRDPVDSDVPQHAQSVRRPRRASTSVVNTLADSNNNPGNLRPVGGAGFREFDSLSDGWAAMKNQLLRYYTGKTTGKRLVTIGDIVRTWAPAADHNKPEVYANNVSTWMKTTPDTRLDLTNPATMAALMQAMARMEGFSQWKSQQAIQVAYDGASSQRTMNYMDETRHYYANAGTAMSPGAIDNSQTSATHINNVNVNGSPQTVDELTQSILEQSRRSGLTGGFLTGVS
ncbi:hypothetical protein [Trabulsiella odontotermitis]|uniref:Uncharacterized protein n=1 Tax=Trabulsiella odontotermitis TaxID=379893 RepID=A0A0L0GXT7_9ENTR|nr:hypothetical protein [Trabulsiella odontotermitis]KNC94030.1 hypothetical protein GM31_16875 [Trabulsiella odontotermitis]